MRSCLPRQSRDWLPGSGLCNTGLSLNVSAVDLAGRQRWLRVRWQCVPNWPLAKCQQNIDSLLSVFSLASYDLEKVQTSSEILFVFCSGNMVFRRDVTKIEQSKHFCNLCCEFMVCIHVKNCAVTSNLVLWLNQFSVWFCFRQCARQSRRRNPTRCRAMQMSWTSTACRTAWLFLPVSTALSLDWHLQSKSTGGAVDCASNFFAVAMASMTRQFVFSSAFNCAFGCGLPVCSRQDGNWTLEDEEAPSQSWHVQARHLVFCFEQLLTMLRFRLMSLFTTFWCIFVLLPPLSIQVRLLWFHDTISVSVSLSFLGQPAVAWR